MRLEAKVTAAVLRKYRFALSINSNKFKRKKSIKVKDKIITFECLI